MGKRKYRTVVVAVLAGAVLFSPLLCGMTCLEMHGIRQEAATGIGTPGPGEFLGEIVTSGMAGCVVAQVVQRADLSEWAGLAWVGSWVWVGVDAIRLAGTFRP